MLHENTWARELLYDEVCTRQDAAVIMCGMWSLWMMRDSRKHGEKPIPVRTAVQWVWETSYELWHLLHLEKKWGQKLTLRWKKPTENRTKCNVDGSFIQHDRTGSYAAVLRNHGGSFLAARAVWQERAQDALMMEAHGCRLGMELAHAQGASRLCLETDSLELVSLWNNVNHQRSAVSFILQERSSQGVRSFLSFLLSMSLDLVIGWLMNVLDWSLGSTRRRCGNLIHRRLLET